MINLQVYDCIFLLTHIASVYILGMILVHEQPGSQAMTEVFRFVMTGYPKRYHPFSFRIFSKKKNHPALGGTLIYGKVKDVGFNLGTKIELIK